MTSSRPQPDGHRIQRLLTRRTLLASSKLDERRRRSRSGGTALRPSELRSGRDDPADYDRAGPAPGERAGDP